ncbi:MAG: nicotinate-nucleotide adenylyltransferase [Elusimicrobiota bacterium]|jgi:nicotinate-nucleotide adenylyltransferase|nr:nicotinate-nucleotide adenylyltransferase [Elusimicrobiota bacterium]
MKIGILGGSFNPIHNVHLIIAEHALSKFGLDKIFFVPAGAPPHKDSLLSKNHRYLMTCLAIQDNKKFFISNFEIYGKKKYSYQTINYFKKIYKNSEIFFIIGMDSLKNIESWVKGIKLLEMCNFIIINRQEKNESLYASKEKKFFEKLKTLKYNKNLFFVNDFNIGISSSMIRDFLKKDISIKYLVPSSVENYIYENNLYR